MNKRAIDLFWIWFVFSFAPQPLLIVTLQEFPTLPLNGKVRDASWPSSIQFNAQQLEDLWRQMQLLLENRKSGRLSPVIGKHVLIDVQGLLLLLV